MSAALIIAVLIEDIISPKGLSHCREQEMSHNLIGNIDAATAYTIAKKIRSFG